MTEDEAKLKWCPHARVLVEADEREDNTNIAGANRLDIKGGGDLDLGWKAARCIGSACMAWRWCRWERTDEHGGSFEAYPYEIGAKPVDGFCGLAGTAGAI